MTWIVRNTLRGTLELHGFMDEEKPVRIAGGTLFDLDTLSTDRQYIESSRQIDVAFREGYLVTESKDQEVICDSVEGENKLDPWQSSMQKQMNLQTQNVEVLTVMMKSLIERLDRKEQNSLDEGRLVGLLKNEIQTQLKLMIRSMPVAATTAPAAGNQVNRVNHQQEKEAQNKARLFDSISKSMDVEFDPKKIVGVKTFVDKGQQTNNMVDLLSNLDNL